MPKRTVKKQGKKGTGKEKRAVKRGAKKTRQPAAKRALVVKTPFSKAQVISTIAEAADLTKKEAVRVMDTLFAVITAHLKKGAPGEFTLPGIAKFKVVRKPATKAREGVNPFTGQTMLFAAKPARNVVKIRVLKKLKEIAK